MHTGYQSFLGELSARVASNEQQLRGLASLLEMLQDRVEALTTEVELDRAKLEALRQLHDETVARAVAAGPITIVAVARPLVEDFTAIRGIDRETAHVLAELRLTSYADIAALNDEDVDIIGARIGNRRRICKENWIEQAALLARGIDTEFVSRTRQGQHAALALAVAQLPSMAVDAPVTTAAASLITPLQPKAAEVIDLAARRNARNQRSSRFASIAASLVACCAVTFALAALPPEIGSQIMRLGNCDSTMFQFDEACTALAWMML